MIKLDQRGSASILALLMMICLFAIMALVSDVGAMFCTKILVKHKLNLALRGAVGADQLNQTALRDAVNPRIEIDPALAGQKFEEILKTNLRLDDAWQPMAGSPCGGQVQILDFAVINTGFPYTYTYGTYSEVINRPSVVGIIQFPYKNSFLAQVAGVDEEQPMTVHVTVAPELVSKHLEEW